MRESKYNLLQTISMKSKIERRRRTERRRMSSLQSIRKRTETPMVMDLFGAAARRFND